MRTSGAARAVETISQAESAKTIGSYFQNDAESRESIKQVLVCALGAEREVRRADILVFSQFRPVHLLPSLARRRRVSQINGWTSRTTTTKVVNRRDSMKSMIQFQLGRSAQLHQCIFGSGVCVPV